MRTAGEPFMRWKLRCAKRENQDLSVLVTRGARARGARARGARARGARARGARSEVRSPRPRRERPVTARGVCHTRSGQTIYSTQHSYIFIICDARISYVFDLLSHTEHVFQKFQKEYLVFYVTTVCSAFLKSSVSLRSPFKHTKKCN